MGTALMKITKTKVAGAYGIKISIEDKGREVGRAFIYLLKNGQHTKPFGLLEDVFVAENQRSRGYGSKLVIEAIKEAKKRSCYKLIATSRVSKPEMKKYYQKFGFKVWGSEFRMDFK